MTAPTIGPVVLVGCTASGKSALALAAARAIPGVELVSGDSMQVYRGMDIGTAKPSRAERDEIVHHLVDIVDPDDDYTVSRFQVDAARAIAEIESRGGRTLVVGGTGLYVQALVDDLDIPGRFPEVRAQLEAEPDTGALHRRLADLDPIAAGRMEPSNRRRVIRALEVTLGSGRLFSSFGPGLDDYPPTRYRLIGLRRPRAEVDRRIEARFHAQLEGGFLDEVAGLASRPGGMSRTARQALGYRELLAHVEDGLDLDEAIELAISRTRQFARKQDRWFRRDPRIEWIDLTDSLGTDHNPVSVLVEALGD